MTRETGWYWTPARVVAAAQVFEEIYGRRPSYTDFNPTRSQAEAWARSKADGWPSGATVNRHWGSWNNMIRAAGWEPTPPGSSPNPLKDRDACSKGHPYTPDNVRIRTHRDGRQQRVCLACHKEGQRASYNKLHKGPGSRASRGLPQSDTKKEKA